jgi:hypothetical protein
MLKVSTYWHTISFHKDKVEMKEIELTYICIKEITLDFLRRVLENGNINIVKILWGWELKPWILSKTKKTKFKIPSLGLVGM